MDAKIVYGNLKTFCEEYSNKNDSCKECPLWNVNCAVLYDVTEEEWIELIKALEGVGIKV